MIITTPGSALPVIFRVLTVICAFIWAAHANAGGLGDFLKAIESLDQSIQEKVQDALGVPEPDNRQAQEEPDPESTAMPVSSEKIRIKAQSAVAKESADTKEEEEEDDEDEPNLISSEKIRLKPDAILQEGVIGTTGKSESGEIATTGSSAGEGNNGQAEVEPQILQTSDADEERLEAEKGEIHWRGAITFVIRSTEGVDSVSEWIESYQLNVDWIETHRIEVRNVREELTGVLVILADHNSRWRGEVSGTTIQQCQQRSYQGEGMGVKTLQYAWTYFSLSDDDPIQGVMPTGTYHVTGHSEEAAIGIGVYKSLCGTPFSDTRDWPFFGLKLMNMGREVWRPMPCSTARTCRSATFRPSVPFISAEALKDKLERESLLELGLRVDPQTRVVRDGVMQGHYSVPVIGLVDARSSTKSVDLTWYIERVVETDVILELAAEYWRPEHDNVANTLSVTASIEQPAIPGKFRFTLFDVTREKGWAMNAGDKDDDSLDLEFVDGRDGFLAPEETSDGWEIEANQAMTTGTVKIKANDYGAWGKLKCEVNVDGHWWPCRTDAGKEYVTIPFDEDENKIADFWEDQEGVSGDAAADDDETPEGREPGDGFSNYEEYRGFQVNAEWTDTNPIEKDLFVHNASGLAEIEGAINQFEIKTGLTVHKISEDELDRASRIVNFNRGSKQALSRRGKGQKGLIVVVRQLDDRCGEAVSDYSTGAVLGGPNITKEVVIDPSCLFGTTAIHELGHGVNLWHPGGRYLDQCGEKIIAGLRTPYAGPMKNYMRYEYAGMYIGPDNKCYKYPSHLEIAPSSFTKSLRGTGMNSGPPGRWEYDTLDGINYPYPVSADATCSGTLIDKSMSLNQDARPAPGGC